MSNNSAHDDILLLNDGDEADEVRKRITDSQSLKVYDLLKTMLDAQKLGDMSLTKQSLTLTNTQCDARIELVTHQLEKPGWTLTSEPDWRTKFDNIDTELTLADFEAIKQGDYEIEYRKSTRPRCWSLDELLSEMDVHGVGRPSTYASIINNLEQENEFIELNETTCDVKLTSKGLLAALILEEVEQVLSKASYSANLSQLLDKVEQGQLEPNVAILKVYEDAYGAEARAQVEDIIWDDVNSLYEEPMVSKEVVGGVIRKQKKAT